MCAQVSRIVGFSNNEGIILFEFINDGIRSKQKVRVKTLWTTDKFLPLDTVLYNVPVTINPNVLLFCSHVRTSISVRSTQFLLCFWVSINI